MTDTTKARRPITTPVRYDEAGIIVDANGVNVAMLYGWARMLPSHALERGQDIAAALNERAELVAEVERLKGENQCDACGGTGRPVSGKPCMCGGSGKMSDAARFLRTELLSAEGEIARRDALLEAAKAVAIAWTEEWDCSRTPGHPTINDQISRLNSVIEAFEALGGKEDV